MCPMNCLHTFRPFTFALIYIALLIAKIWTNIAWVCAKDEVILDHEICVGFSFCLLQKFSGLLTVGEWYFNQVIRKPPDIVVLFIVQMHMWPEPHTVRRTTF